METISIEILDDKAKPLLDNLVKRNLIKIKKSVKSPKVKSKSIFDFAGLWKKRDVNHSELREKAWSNKVDHFLCNT
ncbi:hypothetical protein [Cognataquiflexum rubidum]|uniref:hypothetical protein n=1 Tax=Cognataquiflexum rubidum TaxID=2922273 RepID=UPI001F132743|nr:hypothetical protein [Cognataquiflexum rubidum]MCH6234941.1 hypothetical protein [Cognataquiflexum rubidum]